MPAELPDEAYYTLAEVAEFLVVSTSTVYTLIENGDLRALRVSKTLRRISRTELQRFMAEGATPRAGAKQT